MSIRKPQVYPRIPVIFFCHGQAERRTCFLSKCKTFSLLLRHSRMFFWSGKPVVAPSYVVHVRPQFFLLLHPVPGPVLFIRHVVFLSGNTQGTERVEILDPCRTTLQSRCFDMTCIGQSGSENARHPPKEEKLTDNT
jgi:hypothetical protein